MLTFCPEIEQSRELSKYQRMVEGIAVWYRESVERYGKMLRTELALQTMSRELEGLEEVLGFSEDLSYQFNTKSSYFSVSDALIKLILSKFSRGPSRLFLQQHGIQANLRDDAWLTCGAGALDMTEILAKVLRDEGIGYAFDLQVFLRDRKVRNALTHSAMIHSCLSAVRCYRNIREMLVFLDPDYENSLPVLEAEDAFSYDAFLADPCGFNFTDCTTVLIADSMHDIPPRQQRILANQPWDLVIDLDGYSDCGGMLSQVKHNRLQKEILYRDVASGPQTLINGSTLWYRCGEYQATHYNPDEGMSIPAYTSFHKNAPRSRGRLTKAMIHRNTEEILGDMLRKADRQERLINIVALTDDYNFIKALINKAEVSVNEYFVTWIGLSDQDDDAITQNLFYGDEGIQQERFRRFNCLPYSFFRKFEQYSENWPPRVCLKTRFSLPAGSERIVLSENDRNNLAPYFDVLYDGCEYVEGDQAEKLRDQFYHGNVASWNTIANDYAICLMDSSRVEHIIEDIRTLLGKTQENSQKRLYFLRHSAGIGGTTLARQIAWKLHDEYAVLSVRNYDANLIRKLIENLYDNVLKKFPIVILADDTLPNIQALCEDVRNMGRRCILLVSCRERNNLLQNYPKAEVAEFNSLPNQATDKLRARFRSHSSLSDMILTVRDKEFDQKIVGKMRTPFIIGLYYIEEDFYIDEYIKRALDGCADRRYADAIACIALCDQYNSKLVPVSLIRAMLGLKKREQFLWLVMEASSLITKERTDDSIDVYHFKHSLLAEGYLNQYYETHYNGVSNKKNAIFHLARKLIDSVAQMGRDGSMQENHIDLLINIMIQNKAENYDELNLSELLVDVGLPESQRTLMYHLASSFQNLADRILAQKNLNEDMSLTRLERLTLRLVSHAYAHLGRLYSRGDRNFEKAQEMHSYAKRYSPDDDPNVYHMAGTSILEKLKNVWNDWDDRPVTDEEYAGFRQDVREAESLFDKACEFGSPDYGIPSTLELYYHYLRFIYRRKGIRSAAQISSLGEEYGQMYSKFTSLLDDAASYNDLNEKAIRRINDYASKFDAEIMFGNYGKAVEYYQNQVDRCRSSMNVVEMEYALRGLVFAKISAARMDQPDVPFYQTVKNPRQLMDEIWELLSQPCDLRHYTDYSTYSRLRHYWMQLAKYLNVSIDTGLSAAKQWMELEELRKYEKNPEPYYYVQVLQYLNGYAGSRQAMDDLKITDDMIYRYASDGRFDARRGNRAKMRDLFVVGNGMGQLMDVTHCRSEDAVLLEAANRKIQPVHFAGHLKEVKYQKGILELYDPLCWSGEKVWIELGKRVENTLTERQVGHKVRFLAGFSVERMVALNDCACDADSGETFAPHERMRALKTEYDKNCAKQEAAQKKAKKQGKPGRKNRRRYW